MAYKKFDELKSIDVYANGGPEPTELGEYRDFRTHSEAELQRANRPPFETFKGATCKGCFALGSACGHCERCDWERASQQFGPLDPATYPGAPITSPQQMLKGCHNHRELAQKVVNAISPLSSSNDVRDYVVAALDDAFSRGQLSQQLNGPRELAALRNLYDTAKLMCESLPVFSESSAAYQRKWNLDLALAEAEKLLNGRLNGR